MLLRNFSLAAYGLRGNRFNSSEVQLSYCVLRLYFIKKMTSCSFEKAITALNGLQSNAAYIQKARLERCLKPERNITETWRHLQNLKLSFQDIDSLNIIHVAGTKGKGSTCAFTENILRNHGYKTGFYSSPHLVSVTERIRINGIPLSKEKFADYFWEVYNAMKNNLEKEENMPGYFLFLTVMAFYVFTKEKVEAAIIEVGIGGLYDCTNFIRKPIVVGITTLDIDHTSLLGSTITEIAAQKAGIMKPNVPAFTVPQSKNAINILRKKAQTIGCSLALSPPLENYDSMVPMGTQGLVQSVNASLALQLSRCWLTSVKNYDFNCLETLKHSSENTVFKTDDFYAPILTADIFKLNSETQNALQHCKWPGRFQILQKDKVTYYLDGAHTGQSIKLCKKWFVEVSQKHITNSRTPILKVLIFNCTGDRKPETLLDSFCDVNFDIVIFCPNKLTVIKHVSSELSNFNVEPKQELQQCITNKEVWCHLMRSMYEDQLSLVSNCSNSSVPATTVKSADNNTVIFSSVTDAVNSITSAEFKSCHTNNRTDELAEMVLSSNHIQVLVTGSLHLIGGILSVLQQ